MLKDRPVLGISCLLKKAVPERVDFFPLRKAAGMTEKNDKKKQCSHHGFVVDN